MNQSHYPELDLDTDVVMPKRGPIVAALKRIEFLAIIDVLILVLFATVLLLLF